VVARGAEVLADGEDVDLAVGEVAEDARSSCISSPMPTMMPVLVTMGPGSSAAMIPWRGEEVERALVAAAGFGDAVEARHGLDVVVEDLGARGDDHAAASATPWKSGVRTSTRQCRGPACGSRDDVDEGLAAPRLSSSRLTLVMTAWARPSWATA
jgi:hypothetical protein